MELIADAAVLWFKLMGSLLGLTVAVGLTIDLIVYLREKMRS